MTASVRQIERFVEKHQNLFLETASAVKAHARRLGTGENRLILTCEDVRNILGESNTALFLKDLESDPEHVRIAMQDFEAA